MTAVLGPSDDLYQAAHEAYENHFHKIAATVSFKTWLCAFTKGWNAKSGDAKPVDAAVAALDVALDVLRNNEPINRTEGNVEQADLEAESATQIETAIERLQTDGTILDAVDQTPLGPVFDEYRGDPEGAIQRLVQEREGDARAVWTRPDIGDIDLVWGNRNAGLAKIVRKHPEALKKLPKLLRHGRLIRQAASSRTVYLVDGGKPQHVTVLRLDWYGAAKTWVLTSYDDTDGKFTGSLPSVDTEALDSVEMGCRSTAPANEGSVELNCDQVNLDAVPTVEALRADLLAGGGTALDRLALALAIRSARSTGEDAQPQSEAVTTSPDQQPSEPGPAAPAYRYALMSRPAGADAVPGDTSYSVEPRPAADQPHHELARHGIIVTSRELTADELKSFDLAPLVDGEDLALLADQLARAMSENARGYLEQAAEDPDHFRTAVLLAVESAASGVRYSVGDPAALAAMVRDKLAAMVPVPIEPAPDGGIAPPAPARVEAMAFLAEVASGRHPQMLEPDLADRIERVLRDYENDAEIQAEGEKAIVAYSNGLMAATGG